MVTFVVTVLVAAVGVGAFLFNEGIVTISRRDVNHTKTVMVDGVVTETKDWNELLGYEVKIDVVDGAYIGK
jgi:hypothetical protein